MVYFQEFSCDSAASMQLEFGDDLRSIVCATIGGEPGQRTTRRRDK